MRSAKIQSTLGTFCQTECDRSKVCQTQEKSVNTNNVGILVIPSVVFFLLKELLPISETLDVAAMCLVLFEFAQNSATASLIGARFFPKMNPIWRTLKRLPSVRQIRLYLVGHRGPNCATKMLTLGLSGTHQERTHPTERVTVSRKGRWVQLHD